MNQVMEKINVLLKLGEAYEPVIENICQDTSKNDIIEKITQHKQKVKNQQKNKRNYNAINLTADVKSFLEIYIQTNKRNLNQIRQYQDTQKKLSPLQQILVYQCKQVLYLLNVTEFKDDAADQLVQLLKASNPFGFVSKLTFEYQNDKFDCLCQFNDILGNKVTNYLFIHFGLNNLENSEFLKISQLQTNYNNYTKLNSICLFVVNEVFSTSKKLLQSVNEIRSQKQEVQEMIRFIKNYKESFLGQKFIESMNKYIEKINKEHQFTNLKQYIQFDLQKYLDQMNILRKLETYQKITPTILQLNQVMYGYQEVENILKKIV